MRFLFRSKRIASANDLMKRMHSEVCHWLIKYLRCPTDENAELAYDAIVAKRNGVTYMELDTETKSLWKHLLQRCTPELLVDILADVVTDSSTTHVQHRSTYLEKNKAVRDVVDGAEYLRREHPEEFKRLSGRMQKVFL